MCNYFLAAVSACFLLADFNGIAQSIPESKSITVKADGQFTKEEWGSATLVYSSAPYQIRVMADSTSIYIGVESSEPAHHYTDLYFSSQQLMNLHASMQLGQRVLPQQGIWNENDPPWVWGNNKGWYANTVRYLIGADEHLPFSKQVYPYFGQEFVISRKLTGDNFKLAISMADFEGVNKAVYFPANMNLSKPTGWFEVSIQSQ